jgi:hypothetical protein
MQVDDGSVPKGDVQNPAKKSKKVDKNLCFRCKQPGHQIDSCIAPVCDICEFPNHISLHVPFFKLPNLLLLCMDMLLSSLCSLRCLLGVHINLRLIM